MSISRQNLSIVIVTFKSEKVIHECISSIDNNIEIIVIENSNNIEFKHDIEKKYKNVRCYLSTKNLGMGAGNNLGLSYVKTDYVLILNPDVILDKATINEIIIASKKIESFAILSPLSIDNKYPNYKIRVSKNHSIKIHEPFKVKSVDGFAMLIDKKKVAKLKDNKNPNLFDENFFMYLENDDLCKRVIDKNENIYIVPNSKINHLGGKATDKKYFEEVELSRNWHWIWSKFYFNRKHYGYLIALIQGLPNFFSAILKMIFYFMINNKIKRNIYKNRALGYTNALFGNSSWYRPKIDI